MASDGFTLKGENFNKSTFDQKTARNGYNLNVFPLLLIYMSDLHTSGFIMSDSPERLLDLTATIVSAHVGHNSTQSDALPSLIQTIYSTLQKLGAGDLGAEAAPLVPAVPIKKSVFSDHIICLEDGKKLKMLKRHLATSFGMTPDEYRKRWNLPADYPMVAPDYAKHRSTLAMKIGLGRKPKAQPATQVPAETEPKITRVAAGVRGRRKKPVSD